MTAKHYHYLDEVEDAVRAARKVVPVILQTVGPIRSVLDRGGGNRAGLNVLRECGVPDVMLYDVAEVEPRLLVPRADFGAVDLGRTVPPQRQVDLVW